MAKLEDDEIRGAIGSVAQEVRGLAEQLDETDAAAVRALECCKRAKASATISRKVADASLQETRRTRELVRRLQWIVGLQGVVIGLLILAGLMT